MTTPNDGTVEVTWDVMCTWHDGVWHASAVGPQGAQRTVTVSVSCASLEGARALLRAMLWLKTVSPSGLA